MKDPTGVNMGLFRCISGLGIIQHIFDQLLQYRTGDLVRFSKVVLKSVDSFQNDWEDCCAIVKPISVLHIWNCADRGPTFVSEVLQPFITVNEPNRCFSKYAAKRPNVNVLFDRQCTFFEKSICSIAFRSTLNFSQIERDGILAGECVP